MKILIPVTVLLLMISVGMSLNWTQFVASWRRLTPLMWMKLLVATFIVPPMVVVALEKLLPLDRGAFVGLFLVAAAPGAPLMTRGVAKRGFDMETAASYQLWGAILTPIMVPLLVGTAGWCYGRAIWIPPREVLAVIAKQQFAPLLIGVALMYFAPGFSIKVRRALNVLGNVLLMVALLVLIIDMGPALKAVSPWVAIAAIVLAIACLMASSLLLSDHPKAQTLVISNVNRFAGLALLISGAHFRNQPTLPAIVAYAFIAPLVMWMYSKFALRIPRTKRENH